ncbi:MAG TPA: histidine triad nucleotide-binding protein [Gammaproteobacteria bacterium]|jgi:histidine triad (HIT) family protein|nr:histidine triad nucleotide-binding protein [Gammaproteobacteria bacterium]
MSCIFCKIVNGDLDAKIAYQDDKVIAFHDVNPQADIHILIIPRAHIATTNDIEPQNAELLGQMVLVAKQLAKEMGIADEGYRIVMNCNHNGGQSVYHIHLHLLGGRRFTWPPG